MHRQLAILPVLVPLVAALIQPILALASPAAAWPIAVAAAAVTTVLATIALAAVLTGGTIRYPLGGWEPPWGIEVVLDPLSGFTVMVLAAVATASLLAGGPQARAYGAREPIYYALALIVLTGLIGMVVSGDLFNVFVFLELSSIASYALVGSGGGRALAAAFRYVILGTMGASFYLLGVGFLYAVTGTLNMADLAARVPDVSGSSLYLGGVVLIAIGLALKMGLFPLHWWLPDVYTYAPSPVASLLAPIATKAAAYMVARILLYVLRPVEAVGLPVGTILAWAGGLSILFGGILAIRQTDARRLLAYSSVGQVGYIGVGLGLANDAALVGAYLHILNHALLKAALFIAVGATALHVGFRTGGLGRGMPVTATVAVVAGLSAVGVPPAGGFFSKWYLLQGTLEARQPLLTVVILLGSLLAVAYMYRLTETVWRGQSAVPRVTPEAQPAVLISLVVLAFAIVAAGVGNTAIVSHVLTAAVPSAR
ncbi:MAG: hypothetical protein HYU51_17070 [Candidatus Rokubacteria bacterium]|nr:hypothetical protein [Candidatus Rokubacteria bacterium]